MAGPRFACRAAPCRETYRDIHVQSGQREPGIAVKGTFDVWKR